MGRTAVLSGNLYVFYWRKVMRVLITSQAALPPEISFAYASSPPQRQQHLPARAVESEVARLPVARPPRRGALLFSGVCGRGILRTSQARRSGKFALSLS